MKSITLTLVLVFGAFLFSACNETKETTEDKTKQNIQTEQKEIASQDEMTSKEKAGEDMSQDDTVKKEVKITEAKLETASFKCSTMTCTGCEQTITGKVKKLNGVQDVKADYRSKTVEVTFASGKVSKDDIAKTIEASGYKCEMNN